VLGRGQMARYCVCSNCCKKSACAGVRCVVLHVHIVEVQLLDGRRLDGGSAGFDSSFEIEALIKAASGCSAERTAEILTGVEETSGIGDLRHVGRPPSA
jgi:hypothetical protein